MRYEQKEQFEKVNAFGTGTANTAYAQYFTGDSFLNPLTDPEGGLFAMAFLPDGMDSQPFVREAIQRGVLCVPGSAFLADEKQVSNAFRLNYSTPTDEQIVKGIEILGKLTHEWIKE